MSASRLLRQSGHQLIPRHVLKPNHTASVSRIRAFHASPPRQSALDTVLILPHELLQFLHLGVPWYAAIPISAFIVRGLLVTTIGSRVRSLVSRYIALHPLRYAIALQKRDEMAKKGGFTNPQEATKAIRKAVVAETRALDSRWNCTLYGQLSWTFLQLPLFFVMTEVIRRMSDREDGLLGMAFKAVGLGTKRETDVLVSGHVADGPAHLHSSPWYEQALGTEGILWFPDLLVPDPTGVLPFIASGLMFTNIWFSSNTSEKIGRPSPSSRVIRKTMLGVALLIGPLCQDIPAGLMLYWASSTVSVMLWNKWLDWRYPAPLVGLCKRPLLLMPPKKPSLQRPRGSIGDLQTPKPR
ncbi:60Kd inner membrane protein-domain-containing protein [Lophiotrema nucula]|uniref:60Kd inner membrane protein-domain-containing protein n=1 Tax=Lophiotrema nucula TaxID=690887 RepID=A0A6A5ZE00_9PLEO|nr:60Kd inner membrane protein-domain-containing protein [Lophiotrema nucula]